MHIEGTGPGNYLWRWTEEYIYAYQTKFSEKYSAEWKAPFTYASSLLSENQEQGKAYLKIMHQSIPPAPRPPPGNCGAFARLVSPGGGAFANFALPGGRAFANPRAIPELLTRTRFPISEYNYKEGFNGKNADWLICQ